MKDREKGRKREREKGRKGERETSPLRPLTPSPLHPFPRSPIPPLTFPLKSLNEIAKAARILLKRFAGYRFFAVYGDMGAGKTTLIKALCKELKVKDMAVSPTFTIINEYCTDTGKPVYHFDFYRLKNKEEVYDIGYEQYFFSENYCFIEWPELVEELLPEEHIKIFISVNPDKSRTISEVLLIG
ncbi:MAG: tRNA (adenosine(37)-N6)-threonylcarbamoyltransferase complex ATPase subunit type 1 TsaE [Bacteroidia bacterium]|nr:tRNA (adenosine(37)-N6)-threonylcarbamoyltransferase complex ATPase subunit type 1 TsaE [Bacteroidia bacterium]